MLIQNQKDFASGLFFIAAGAVAVSALNLNDLGTLARMGPTYFPMIIGTSLMITGALIAVKSVLTTPPSIAESRIAIGRPLAAILILGSAALCAALLLKIGFVLAISLMVFVSSLAHPSFRVRDALISAVLLTALSALLFIGGLGLIVPLWPVLD